MGVTYKLKDEVVHFIISQRQGNPLYSCRQLAESASEKFGLHLSKSSVHDVLKESGIVTPRGRKPKDKFKIPQEKKQEIQKSLSQVKLLAPTTIAEVRLLPDIIEAKTIPGEVLKEVSILPEKSIVENTPEYQGAGNIFLKAALWDLGIFSQETLKESDWAYYLTYSKGLKVVLDNNRDFFVELSLPLERCIREVADGLVSNIKPFIVDKVSDQELFKACMEAKPGHKITNVFVVGHNDHKILEFNSFVDIERKYMLENRLFVECYERMPILRAKTLFFAQSIDNDIFIEKTSNLNGFDTIGNDEVVVNLTLESSDIDRISLQEAVEKLNKMYLYDEQNRLVRAKIQV